MKQDQKNNESSIEIKDLIEKERQEGLKVFRKTGFPAKLEARIKSGTRPNQLLPHWLKSTVMISSILLIIVITAVIMKNFFIPTTPYLEGISIIERFLLQAPNLQRASQAQDREKVTITPGTEEFYRLEWSIQRIILSVKREEINDGDIPYFIYKVVDRIGELGKKKLVIHPEEENQKNLLNEIRNIRKKKNIKEFFSQILKNLEEV
jgi:hypothetical protein